MYEPALNGNTPVFFNHRFSPMPFSGRGRTRRLIAPGRKFGGRGKGALKGKGFGMLAASIGIPLVMKLLSGKGGKKKHAKNRLKGRGILSSLLKVIGLGKRSSSTSAQITGKGKRRKPMAMTTPRYLL